MTGISDPMDLFEIGMDRVVPGIRPVMGGTILNLGCGTKKLMGTVPLDLPDWDAEKDPIPYNDSRVSHILAFHFLEHIQRIVPLLRECERVLVPGGTMSIVVPYGVSDGGLQDLDHKHFFTEDTWKNTFNNNYYKKDPWRFEVQFNMIMGVVHRNLALVTQLVKV